MAEVIQDSWSSTVWNDEKRGRLYIKTLEDGVAVSVYGYETDEKDDVPKAVGVVGYFTGRTKQNKINILFDFLDVGKFEHVKGCVAWGYGGKQLASGLIRRLKQMGVQVEVDEQLCAKRVSLRSDGLLDIIYCGQHKTCEESAELIPMGSSRKYLSTD
jgi:hypothetical protein